MIPAMDERPEISRAAFDRYVERHGIPPEHYPAAFALCGLRR
jgi:hypothetical protein